MEAAPDPTRRGCVAHGDARWALRRLAMGMEVGEGHGALATPNVVPLIDILLVLIIIFMVITPRTPNGLDALVPQPSPNQQQNVELENKTVVVQVAMNGKLKINQEDTTWDGLGPRMRPSSRSAPKRLLSSRARTTCCLWMLPAPSTSCAAPESTRSA